MLKQVIRLTQPGVFLPYFSDEAWPDGSVAVRPTYLSICAADQRYFQGDRPKAVLRAKLPMALLHEAVGEVLHDSTGTYASGDKVVLVPCAESSGPAHLADNYREGGRFHSSNCDGFAQELIALPHSQLVRVEEADEKIYVFAELMSVCVHAVQRWQRSLNTNEPGTVGIWGDGALGYILALALKALEPAARVVVFGKHDEKLAFFSFADKVVNIAAQSATRVHHAFECVGGAGAESAIREIVHRIYPQGSIFLLGVSELDPSIHTRLVLEKGLVMVGCSRSSYRDFETAAGVIHQPAVQGSLQKIISDEFVIRRSADLERAFKSDISLPFKGILQWAI